MAMRRKLIVGNWKMNGLSSKITGGLRLPNDETGDCFKFANELAARAKQFGVRFVYDTEIRRLQVQGRRVVGVRTHSELFGADAFVVATGSFSTALLKPLGIDAPVYPVKGYSITLPIVDPTKAPVSTIMDETFKIAICQSASKTGSDSVLMQL